MSNVQDDSQPNTKTKNTESKPNRQTQGRKTTTRARKQAPIPKEDRYPNVRPDAQYVSDSGQEYVIEKTSTGFFWIKRYKGGEINEKMKGLFTSYRDAEMVLISYLRNTDKLNRAWWPGKLNARMDLPYGASVS